VLEWSGSSKMRASGSLNTGRASSKDTPCLASLAAALLRSYSNLRFIASLDPNHILVFVSLRKKFAGERCAAEQPAPVPASHRAAALPAGPLEPLVTWPAWP
jgi:hypothetical protein